MFKVQLLNSNTKFRKCWNNKNKVEKIKLNFSVLYCDSVGMLVDNKSHCSSTNSVNKPLALYSVSVDYQPLFFILSINIVLPFHTLFLQTRLKHENCRNCDEIVFSFLCFSIK